MQIVAEAKTHSPFGWHASHSWDELLAVANEIGDIISIHTDPRWQGSLELVRKARQLTTKPILAKGIHATDREIENAIEAGADFVLVVGRIPKNHINQCWLEPNSLTELIKYPKDTRVVWNSRDLQTGQAKAETFAQARQAWPGWLCQASFICTPADIDPGADAILVGTNLLEFATKYRKPTR